MKKRMGTIFSISFLVIFLLLISVLPVLVSSYETNIQKATEYLQQGKFNEAILELENALMLIRQNAKLEFNKVQFVSEEPQGYGIYYPRDNNIFSFGETIYIYGEPENYTIKEIENGIFEIYLTEDLYILDKENKVLFGQIDFGEFHYLTRSPVQDMMFYNTVTQDPATAFPPGEYKLRLVLKDIPSQRMVEALLDFEIK